MCAQRKWLIWAYEEAESTASEGIISHDTVDARSFANKANGLKSFWLIIIIRFKCLKKFKTFPFLLILANFFPYQF